MTSADGKLSLIFLSTPSARRATAGCGRYCNDGQNFYPRPPRGGRRPKWREFANALQISIHALREEGDADDQERVIVFLNFYPRPPRGGRPPTSYRPDMAGVISIHALREEGDAATLPLVATARKFLSTPSARRATCMVFLHCCLCCDFYPRPPRGGRPSVQGLISKNIFAFLSTPSARRATTVLSTPELPEEFLSTPSARRATYLSTSFISK